MKFILIATAALLLSSVASFAHNGIEHVMGTVTAVTETSITVDTVKHKPVTVIVNPSTTFTHTDAKASFKDLRVGERVVINAKPGNDDKLQGVSVRWGAGAKAALNHSSH